MSTVCINVEFEMEICRLESVPEMNYDALDPKEPKGEVRHPY